MDLKNIIAAITLSAAVIVLYGLFFAPTQEELSKINEKGKNEINQNTDAPIIDEKIEVKAVTREDAIKKDNRIIFENSFIKGSISLLGGAIDDLELKAYNKTLKSNEKIQLLNPASTNNGYTFNTGWATRANIETPNSNTIWEIDGTNKLTPSKPVKIYYENDSGIRFERLISIDEKYLFSIKQTLINKSQDTFKVYPFARITRNSLPSDLTDFYILHEGYTFITGEKLIFNEDPDVTRVLTSFVENTIDDVKSIIQDLDLNLLEELNKLINLDDEELMKISDRRVMKNDSKIISLLKEFKKNY